MLVLAGITAMLVYVYARPHEAFPALASLGFPTLIAFTLLGYLFDLGLGATRRPRATLLTVTVLAFFGWATVTVAVRAPEELAESLLLFAPLAVPFLAAAQGLSGVRGFWAAARTVVAVALVLGSVAIHQGFSPRLCIVAGSSTYDEPGEPRPCSTRADCAEGGVPGQDYLCEHVGLFGTTSDNGRVRYRGFFQDPNELAWLMSTILPFAFAWVTVRSSPTRRTLRGAVAIAVLAVSVVCNVMTRSRSGQISLAVTLGVYFIRRLGWLGAAVGGLAALPVLLLGGRSDESSTQERLECWAEAISLWRERPLLGVGTRQFTKHHYLTAHNSFLLALSEMGPLGLLLWTVVLYLAFKIAIQVQRDFAARPEAQAARAAAQAMLAALTGTVASAVFLSLTYHPNFWMLIGLAGALQAAVTRHDPEWRVRWRFRDTAFVLGLDVVIVSAFAVYLRLRGV